MSGRAGVELTPTRLRGVVAPPWRDAPTRTVEVAWDPAQPRDGVAALGRALGDVSSVAIAVGLGLLHVKRVELPPAGDEARERMLALAGERFFASNAPVVAALAPGSAIAFAADAEALEGWITAFATLATVVRVEPSPTALARSLGAASSGAYRVEAGEGEHGVVVLEGGRVTRARRIPAAVGDAPGGDLPAAPGIPAPWRAASGAMLGEDADERGTLATPARRAGFRAARWRRLAVATAAACAGLAFAVFALDRWRERTLSALGREAAMLREAAAPAEEAMRLRARLGEERALLRRHAAGREEVLQGLAAISAALPEDAVVLAARASGAEWQLDGTAADAAALVPRLDRDGRFEQVRARSASTRFQDAGRTRETFSITLRVRPLP